MTSNTILIAGAGPTGLVLALGLARRGVPFRLISDAKGPGEHSRAMGVHARTLEFYRQFSFGDEVVARGIKPEKVRMREGGGNGAPREIMHMKFSEMGEGISPYPYMLTYPQDDHERFLIEKLNEAGGHVEWETKLTGFTQDAEGVLVNLAHADGKQEEVSVSYLCGCDGAHSKVRETLGVGFSGGTYDQLFYVADVKIDGGFQSDIVFTLGEHILSMMMPVRSTGMQRLIGLVPPELSARHDLTFEDVRTSTEQLLGIKVGEVNWFSNYRVHHRVADHFQAGRIFLLGDAGHIHSPVGGQGMNTGIGDAINLGWKLAQVVQRRAPETLLESYEAERIGFARKLVSTTDRAFTPMVADGIRGELTRRLLAPLVMGVATRFAAGRHALFRTVSQTAIHYGESLLSQGKAGHVHGGDRLPWVPGEPEDNFAPLRSVDWQLHIYGTSDDHTHQICERLQLPMHVFACVALYLMVRLFLILVICCT
jgi:2-polyprenyl-6-methoxyphenol hydroxylase-like FAD-dependent oxidoreductase